MIEKTNNYRQIEKGNLTFPILIRLSGALTEGQAPYGVCPELPVSVAKEQLCRSVRRDQLFGRIDFCKSRSMSLRQPNLTILTRATFSMFKRELIFFPAISKVATSEQKETIHLSDEVSFFHHLSFFIES